MVDVSTDVVGLREELVAANISNDGVTTELVVEHAQGGEWVPVGTVFTVFRQTAVPFVLDTPGRQAIRVRATQLGDVAYSPIRYVNVIAELDPDISRVTADDLGASWESGCPVGPKKLRAIDLTHLGMDGRLHRGRLIAHRDVVDDLVYVFARALTDGFPIRQMVPVSEFDGDDEASMAADNTSVFNCRRVVGRSSHMSEHAYGTAIDINPMENPYRVNGRTYPEGAVHAGPGAITEDSVIVRAMRKVGWGWGRAYSDLHHFSDSGW